MKFIISISILKIKKLGLEKLNNLFKVKEVTGLFSHHKIRKSFLFSFQEALENGDYFGYWIWKHQEGLLLVILCILLPVEVILFCIQRSHQKCNTII